ncbi:MAG: MFS transporter [Chloroflexi bacterium]|nr:MAG: MFS transporter [Chloroflexota bacterium]
MWITVGVFVAAGPIAIAQLTGRASLGGLLFALWAVALGTGAQLGGLLMDRFGRRPGLSIAQLLLGLASIMASVSVLRGSTAGLFASAIFGGLGSGAALLARAAVADMYPIERRGVAVGFLLAAGTVGAIVGPQLVQLAHLLSPQSSQSARLAASWMIAAIFSAVAFGCMLALRPDPKDLAPPRKTSASTVKRSLRTLLQLPAMRAGAIAMGLAQGAMTGLMAVYAIAASARGVGIGVIALILSAHFSGMFGFSPVWGVFLDRIGRRDGLLAGAALIAIGGLTIGLPHAALSALGLFLVGLGWSGTYLGGTTVISDITTPAERGTALGFTDLLSAGAGAVGALSAGIVLDASGLSALGASMGAILVGVIILLLLVPRTSWRAGVAAATTP